jgi:hypothetical protein
MPERSFRVLINNASSSLTLQKTFDHLCGGDWTPAWSPPQTINPGQAGQGLQSESAGIATGTEGYVKYDVVSGSGKMGMIYVYWDNPWYGNTHFRFDEDTSDIFPDCDFDIPAGGSGFPSPKPTGFSLVPISYAHGEAGGGDITGLGDLINYVPGPVVFLGLLGIDKNPTLTLELRETDVSPQFQDLGAKSLKPMSNATLDDWVGEWVGEGVQVTITRSALLLEAAIMDSGHGEPFELTTEFGIGAPWLYQRLRQTSLTSVLGGAQDVKGPGTRILQRAALSAIQTLPPSAPRAAVAQHFVNAVAAEDKAMAIPAGRAVSAGRLIARAVDESGWMAQLDQGVVLSLYAVMQGGQQISKNLHYQRFGRAQLVQADVMLNPYYPLH